MKYAVVASGLVSNVILLEEVDADIERAFDGMQLVRLEPDSIVSQGWAYASGEFLAPQSPAPGVPPVEARIAHLRDTVQAHLDAGARALGYDDIKTAVTYADEPAVAKFQVEGQALRAWRSLVWQACYGLLASWQAGEADEPAAEELITMLPVFQAPEPEPEPGPGSEPEPEPEPETPADQPPSTETTAGPTEQGA